MKSTMLAAALAALSVVTAHAAEFFSPPVPLDPTSEFLAIAFNTCKSPATYDIVIRNATSGKVLRRKQGTLAANRGTILSYSFGASQTGSMVYHNITWECQASARPQPLVGFAVRDLETKAPRFAVGALGDTATHE
jgi:hypothetical protein